VDSLPLIVNLPGVGRRGQPPGEKPAGDGNVDIRILTSYFGLFILLPGKRTLAILLTGSNIPEGEAGAMLGLSPRIRSILQGSCDLPALESVWNEPAKIAHGRVGLGGRPPRPPTDPDVQNSSIRFLIS